MSRAVRSHRGDRVVPSMVDGPDDFRSLGVRELPQGEVGAGQGVVRAARTRGHGVERGRLRRIQQTGRDLVLDAHIGAGRVVARGTRLVVYADLDVPEQGLAELLQLGPVLDETCCRRGSGRC